MTEEIQFDFDVWVYKTNPKQAGKRRMSSHAATEGTARRNVIKAVRSRGRWVKRIETVSYV